MRFFSRNMFAYMAATVWRHAGDGRRHMLLFYGLFGLANIAISLQPVVLAGLINTAQQGGDKALPHAFMWVGAYAGLTLLFWSLHGPARVIERRVAFRVYQDFVTGLYDKVTAMPLRWHQDHHSGGIINRVNKAGRALFQFAQGQFVILQTSMRFAVSLIVLACYSWWVALASIVSSIVIVALIRRFDRKLIPLVRATNEREHSLNAALYDYIGNIVTVLTLRLQANTGDEITRRFGAMKPSFWPEIIVNEQKWFMLNFMLITAQAVIVGAYIIVHLARHDVLIIGSVVAIFQYLLTINQMFFQGTLSYEQLLYQHTDLRGIDVLIDDHARLAAARPDAGIKAWDKIEIKNLNFTHHEGEDVFHHLRQVRLAIKAGQKIALIGSSGSGKTTLLTLLRGLYDAQDVDLAIDGRAFDNLAPLSGFTALVPQESEIFENTVRYNLTLGTEVADDVVEQALHVTTFDAVAPKMSQGLDTDIRERGVNLSGGQKQRLALTRGLIAARHSSLLLLDEPTSSVDLATEGLIFDRLFAACRDKTIVASVHRLHLLPRFDVIGLMRDGVLIEQGGFDELMEKGGEFYRLWQHHLAQTAAA